jgi:hypothetical protein
MTLDTALLLDIFDEPIVFHRSYVPIAGGITAALFLSHAGYACEDQPNRHDGWFTRSQAEWERDTGLTRREQETARRLLARARPAGRAPGRHARRALVPGELGAAARKPGTPVAQELGGAPG